MQIKFGKFLFSSRRSTLCVEDVFYFLRIAFVIQISKVNRLSNVNNPCIVDLPSGTSRQAFSPFREDVQDTKWQIEAESE